MSTEISIALISGGFILVAAIVPQIIQFFINRDKNELATTKGELVRLEALIRRLVVNTNAYYQLEKRYAAIVAELTNRTTEAVRREQRRLLEEQEDLRIETAVSSPSALRGIDSALSLGTLVQTAIKEDSDVVQAE